MSEIIYWVLAVRIHPGQQETFKAFSAELIESTRNEVDTLNYEWSLSGDGEVCHIYERYADSRAIMVHIERNGDTVGKLFAVSTPLSFVVYGAPQDEVKAALADLNPVYMTPLDGFSR